MTSNDFRSRYPEFDSVSEGLVSVALLDAALQLADRGDWLGRYDVAHGLQAAHILWGSPCGASMRLDGDGKAQASPYLRRYDQLVTKTFPGFLVT